MTRAHQWMLAIGLVIVAGGTVGVVRYGLRDELAPVDVGSKAPDFEVTTLFTRQKHTLADYKGQVVLLNVWATWCGPCRAEMPNLERLYKEFGPKGLKILAVNAQDMATDSVVQAFTNGYDLTFDIARDLPAPGRDSLTQTYRITGFPESFVIDKSGMIRKKWAACDDWSSDGNRSLIANLLDLPVPKPLVRVNAADPCPR